MDTNRNRIRDYLKYPSVILKGNHSVGEFYSVALTRYHQQADTGTKMIHLGQNTRSTIVAKGISAGSSSNTCEVWSEWHPQQKGLEISHNVTHYCYQINAALIRCLTLNVIRTVRKLSMRQPPRK